MPRGHTVLLMAACPPPAPWPQVPVVAGTSPAAAATPCCGPWGVPCHPRTLPSYFWLFPSWPWAPVGLLGAGGSGDAAAMPLGERSCARSCGWLWFSHLFRVTVLSSWQWHLCNGDKAPRRGDKALCSENKAPRNGNKALMQ